MKRMGWIVALVFIFSSGIAVSRAYALEGYTDSGLPCSQVSGSVLCNVDFPDSKMPITVSIPINAYANFPKSPQDLISDIIDFANNDDRFVRNFYGAFMYKRLPEAVANTCLGGTITTHPQVPYFSGKNLGLQNLVCNAFPWCNRFWVVAYGDPDNPRSIHSSADSPGEWGIDAGDPDSYGVRLQSNAFPPVSVPACGPLNTGMSLSFSPEQIEENGSYTVSWNSGGNPGVICTLAGKMPANFSSSDNSGNHTFFNVPLGVYTHTFTCTGILDGNKSGKSGSITRTKTVKVGDIPPPPAGQLTTSATEIKKGEAVTLSWNVSNGESVTIDQGVGKVSNTGSIKVFPKFTTRYSLEAIGKYPELGGKLRSSVTIRVQTPTLPPPPLPKPPETVTPTIPTPSVSQPTSVSPPVEEPKLDLKVNGQDGPVTLAAPASFEISWNLDRYCIAYGSGWLGVKSKAATQNVINSTPGAHTYKMYCPGFSSTSDSVTVNIVSSEVEIVPSSSVGTTVRSVAVPVAEAGISSDGVTYSRSVRVVRGKPISLWISASKDIDGDKKASRDANGGWSEIQNSGRCQFNADLNQGTPTFEGFVDEPATPTECDVPLGEKIFNDLPGVYRYGALRIAQGDGSVSAIAYINVAVVNPPPPKGPPVIDLNVNGKTGKVTLGVPSEYTVSWVTQDADICTASGAWNGKRSVNGNQTFVGSAKRELTYALTCKGKLGTTTQSVILKLAEVPVCAFTALPTVLDKRSVFVRESELAWNCTFADRCQISPSVGVSIKTFGSLRISPSVSTTYTLTCGNAEGEQTFDASVGVR